MEVLFSGGGGLDVLVAARPGENIADVAAAAGVDFITLGCASGACGICEVEVTKREAGGAAGGDGDGGAAAIVVRACVAALPPGYARVEVREIVDAIWGVDGFDT
jgi:hypothetical protein